MRIWTQKLASIQQRTSPLKFAVRQLLAEQCRIREVPPRSPATTGTASTSPLDKQAKIDKRFRERFRLDGTVEYVDPAAPEVSSASAGLTSRRTFRKLFQLFRPKVDNAVNICQN